MEKKNSGVIIFIMIGFLILFCLLLSSIFYENLVGAHKDCKELGYNKSTQVIFEWNSKKIECDSMVWYEVHIERNRKMTKLVEEKYE